LFRIWIELFQSRYWASSKVCFQWFLQYL